MDATQLVEVRIRQKQLAVAATLAASKGTAAALAVLRASDETAKSAAEMEIAVARADEMLARHEFECLTQLTDWIEEYMPQLEKESNKIQREQAAQILPQIIQSVMVAQTPSSQISLMALDLDKYMTEAELASIVRARMTMPEGVVLDKRVTDVLIEGTSREICLTISLGIARGNRSPPRNRTPTYGAKRPWVGERNQHDRASNPGGEPE
jgi:hypothetical protein